MRAKVLGAALAVMGLLQAVSLTTGVRAVESDDWIIADPAGDATDFAVATGAPSAASTATLDVVAADIQVTAETLTTKVKVADMTAEPPPGGTGKLFRWYFTYAGMEFQTRGSQGVAGEQYRLYDGTNTQVPCPGCSGAFDVSADTVTVNVPLVVLNAAVGTLSNGNAPPIGVGSELTALEVLAQREASTPPVSGVAGSTGVTPSADLASTDEKCTITADGGCAAFELPAPPPALGAPNRDEIGDATVIAVVDFNLVPYHWDFDGAYMPQHRDADPVNDLPLATSPEHWLPGFPAASSFASFGSLPLNLVTDDPEADMVEAAEADAEVWETVPTSAGSNVHYRWIPGTKVIGAIDFGGTTMRGTPEDHGVGVTSVSAGNLHGTCPECLIVFVNIATPYDPVDDPAGAAGDPVGAALNTVGPLSRQLAEDALAWASSQPWIDVVTNSWGANLVGGPVRDNLYGGKDSLSLTRSAVDRGQTWFFSAGNGIENGFIAPNTTYGSAYKGPDWMMTVGAIAPPPSEGNYSGAGKPVDLASYGDGYPSAYTAGTAAGTGATGFSGTSNATPVVAGVYARSLLAARSALPGPSRSQADGVVAVGSGGVACGAARPDCELGDGVLTAKELRTRLLEGAMPMWNVTSVGGLEDVDQYADDRFASEGHGAYRGRQSGIVSTWMADQERVLGPLFGRSGVAARPAGEREWMTVDSFCRQHLWGGWKDGYYQAGSSTLPGPDPVFYPLRTAIQTTCPALVAPPTP